MRSITYAEKSWLLGDEAAEAVVEYAVVLARTGSADSISLNALSPAGNPQLLTIVIGPATMMTSSDTDLAVDEPDNAAAIAIIRERIDVIESPPLALPATDATEDVPWEDLA